MGIQGFEDYEIKEWVLKMESFPESVVASESRPRSYETHAAHVFKLQNGKYALVVEDGCSCYSASDALVELFPLKKVAMEKFSKWQKENPRDY